jgi:hypothetical protein
MEATLFIMTTAGLIFFFWILPLLAMRNNNKD